MNKSINFYFDGNESLESIIKKYKERKKDIYEL